MNRKIQLKSDVQDAFGKRIESNIEYDLILLGRFCSIIEDDKNRQYYINNKYIKNLPRA